MSKFRNKENGCVWDITNEEHLRHFRSNPRYEEIKEVKKIKKVTKTSKKKNEIIKK